MQFYLQLQHLHYLQYWYDTNIYTYNILTNYTTYTYTTYTCTTLQYDTKKKKLKEIWNYLQYDANAAKKDTSTIVQLLKDWYN